MREKELLQEVVGELFKSELRDFVLRSLRLSEMDIVPVPIFTIPYIKADKAPLQLRVRVGDDFLTYKSMMAIAVLRYKRKMLISKEDKKVVVLQRWFRGGEQDLPEGSRVITVRDVLFWEPETRVLFIYPGVATKTGQVDKVFNLERRAYCLIEPKVVESEGKDAKQYPVPVITPLLDQPVSLSKEFMEDLKLIQQHLSWRLGLAEESPIYKAVLDKLNLRAEVEEEEVSPEEEEDIAF
jgi:hypothetical protein